MAADLQSTLKIVLAEASENHQTPIIASSTDSPDIQDLIDEVPVGAPAWFDGLVRRYSNRIYRFILKNVGRSATAEDLTQETFLEAYRTLPTFRGESKLSSWLFGIALNRVRNYINRSPEVHHYYLPTEVLRDSITADGNPVQSLERKRVLLALQEAIDTLPKELRESLILVVLEGFSYEEAAQVMGIAVGTVKSRVHHAREMLRTRIKPKLDN